MLGDVSEHDNAHHMVVALLMAMGGTSEQVAKCDKNLMKELPRVVGDAPAFAAVNEEREEGILIWVLLHKMLEPLQIYFGRSGDWMSAKEQFQHEHVGCGGGYMQRLKTKALRGAPFLG